MVDISSPENKRGVFREQQVPLTAAAQQHGAGEAGIGALERRIAAWEGGSRGKPRENFTPWGT